MITYRTAPFRGWPEVRSTLSGVNCGGLLRILIAHAWRLSAAQRGRFVGDETFHVTNMVPLFRAVARAWIDQGEPPLHLPSPNEVMLLEQLACEFGEEAQRDVIEPGWPRLESRKHVFRRACRTMWVSSLQMRTRNRVTIHEYGRTWELLRRLWDERRYGVMTASEQRKGIRPPAPLLTSGFESLETHVLLLLIATKKQGWVEDLEQYLSSTELRASSKHLLRLRIPSTRDVVGDWDAIESETRSSLRNPFIEEPFIRLGDAAVAIPDPGAALTAVQDRALQCSVTGASTETQTLVGYVYESYIGRLLEECALHSTVETYHGDLKESDNCSEGSPDHFLLAEGHALVFEVKSTRYPEPPDRVAELDGLLDLMETVAGRRVRGSGSVRGPLEQGHSFMQRWGEREPRLEKSLGPLPRIWAYLIVVPFEWPAAVHWHRFRDELWRTRLGSAQRKFDQRVVFVSHVDLETAAMVLRTRASRQEGTSLGSLLAQWIGDGIGAHPLRAAGKSSGGTIRGGLADYLYTFHSADVGSSLPFLQDASEALFEDAAGLAFSRSELRSARTRRGQQW